MAYSAKENKLAAYIRAKVRALYAQYPVPQHDFAHSRRVAVWARIIVAGEKAKSPFLCELAAWLHDIGRVAEHYDNPSGKTHHELSYDLLQKWFREDIFFNILKKPEKLELLYAVRYHWNDSARKYQSAIILRDSDKLDMFGKIGLKRTLDHAAHTGQDINTVFFKAYYMLAHFGTKTARKIMREREMMRPVERYIERYRADKIEPVKL